MTTPGSNATKARVALALLFAVPTLASATWVMQPTDSAVRGTYAGWEIAVKEPQTTSGAFASTLAHAPSWKSLEGFLRTIYFDREVVVDATAHTMRVSDRMRRLPMLASEYRARFDTNPPAVPDTPIPYDVASANAETATLANHPVATVHVAQTPDGRPSLVCKVQGAVVLTAWSHRRQSAPRYAHRTHRWGGRCTDRLGHWDVLRAKDRRAGALLDRRHHHAPRSRPAPLQRGGVVGRRALPRAASHRDMPRLIAKSPHQTMRPLSSPSWGRSQKYHRRTRHLYALLFADRSCYVGQTIELKRRWAEHRRAWRAPFVPIELETMEGTQADAEEHEYA